MDLSLNGKTALVTGGSKGIGKGIAASLAAEGCNVVICARHKEQLVKTAEELSRNKARVLPVVADLTDTADIHNLVDEAVDEFGKH